MTQDSQKSSQKNSVLGRLRGKAKQFNRANSWGQEALEINSQILSLDPQDVAALTRRARCRRFLKDFQGAERDYRQAYGGCPERASGPAVLNEMAEEARKHTKKVELERNKKQQQSRRLEEARTFAEAYRLARYAILAKPPTTNGPYRP